jgi:hypothetical protein
MSSTLILIIIKDFFDETANHHSKNDAAENDQKERK